MRTAALAQASTTRRDECRTTRTSRISPLKSCCTTRKWSATTALHFQRSAAGQDAEIGATPRATYKIAHICPALIHGVLTRMRGAGKQEENPARWTRLIQDPASELPGIYLLGTTVNKVAHKLGTASQGRDAVPFEVAVRLGWLLPCLPGDRRRCGGRRRFGDRFGLLCFVHTAPEVVAHPDGPYHGTN